MSLVQNQPAGIGCCSNQITEESARAARAEHEEKHRKKEDKAAPRNAEREISEPPSDEKDTCA
jgi:hypothetical protein